MTPKSKALVLILILFWTHSIQAQDEAPFNPAITPASIPSAPAFSLLGVNPEIVTRPSDVKQFKVDWRIKNYNIAPDLALEAQPIWWIFFRNKSPMEYHVVNPLLKVLSTTSVSMATAKMDNLNHLAWALKFNLYKEKDPSRDRKYFMEKEKALNEELAPLEQKLDTLNKLIHNARFAKSKDSLRRLQYEKEGLLIEKTMITRNSMENLKADAQAFIENNWNMDMLDIAFGRVYNYNNGALDSLNFESAGYGVWVNAAKGFGKHSLLTGLVRMNRVGELNNWMLGMSYRYGSERFNFFTEFVYHRLNNHFGNGFLEDEIFAEQREEDLGTGWYAFEEGEALTRYTIAYGGDFRLSRNILLNFALRTEYTDDMKFSKLLPVANLICLMNFNHQ